MTLYIERSTLAHFKMWSDLSGVKIFMKSHLQNRIGCVKINLVFDGYQSERRILKFGLIFTTRKAGF